MAGPGEEDVEDKPLDPAVERVQQRLRRLMLISTGTLGLGFVAVIVAIIFRVSNLTSEPVHSGEAWRTTIELPAGTNVVSTETEGANLIVHTDGPEGRSVHVFDMPTGRRIGTSVLITR